MIGEKAAKTILRPVGYGHPAGKNWDIFRGLNGITSAGTIVELIEVKYIP